MGWTWYNIKELYAARVKRDIKGSTTGPEYLHKVLWDGAKKIGLNLNQEQQILTGNGLPIDVQSSLGGIEVAVETGVLTPEVEAVIYNQAHSETPESSDLVWHEDSGGVYAGVWARTDKVGANGEDVVLWIANVQFATYNKDANENQHRNLVYNGQAAMTKSSIQYEEINDETGILETKTKRFAFKEMNRRVAARLVAEVVGYLTVLTATPIAAHPIANPIVIELSRQVKRASVNKSTVLFKQGSTPVAFALSLDDEDDLIDNEIVVTPAAALANETAYTVTLKETVQDIHGNMLEEDTIITINTAAA